MPFVEMAGWSRVFIRSLIAACGLPHPMLHTACSSPLYNFIVAQSFSWYAMLSSIHLFIHYQILSQSFVFASSSIPNHIEPHNRSPVATVIPQYGTSVDIIRACLATSFICAWVAIHPNVPPRGEGRIRTLWRRFKLILCTLLVPEFLLLWAYRQWAAARFIAELLNGTHCVDIVNQDVLMNVFR
jgi:hypothetical protein